ncbi:MAG: 2-hydroxyacid dehydrogenase [Eubacteriales bacterium]|jgi:D-lactate dehydrogenase
MKKIAFFDTKPYDRTYFDKYGKNYEITYFEEKLNHHTAKITEGFDGVCAFVNSNINKMAVERMHERGVKILAMRCAGFSNVDIAAAAGKLAVVRVPAYSPHAVAEHALALLLALNRRIYRAYIRTRDFNFNINGLTGIDLYGKTAGIIGTGKIGRTFIDLCKGLGMKVIAYDPYPAEGSGIEYVPLDTLFRESDVISLHCPLTESSHHIIDREALGKMKDGAFLLNTSRGALVDSEALLEALTAGKLRGAALDVYEEEANLFYEDMSDKIIKDDTLALLVSRPNVLITSHQAFLTEEALDNIASVTIQNFDEFFAGKPLTNEIKLK